MIDNNAVLAQLVEQPPCKRQVVGAEPTHGSMRRTQARMLVLLVMFDDWSVNFGGFTRLPFVFDIDKVR